MCNELAAFSKWKWVSCQLHIKSELQNNLFPNLRQVCISDGKRSLSTIPLHSESKSELRSRTLDSFLLNFEIRASLGVMDRATDQCIDFFPPSGWFCCFPGCLPVKSWFSYFGRQFSTFYFHWVGMADLPWIAPSKTPQIAALVSMSPPCITMFTTPSSRFGRAASASQHF